MSLEQNRIKAELKEQQDRILAQRSQDMDNDEILKDYTLIQNLKKRKLSQEQFDLSFGNESPNKISRTSENEEEEGADTEETYGTRPDKKKRKSRRQMIRLKRERKALRDAEREKAAGLGTPELVRSKSENILSTKPEYIPPTWKKGGKVSKYPPGQKNTDKYNKKKSKGKSEKKLKKQARKLAKKKRRREKVQTQRARRKAGLPATKKQMKNEKKALRLSALASSADNPNSNKKRSNSQSNFPAAKRQNSYNKRPNSQSNFPAAKRQRSNSNPKLQRSQSVPRINH